MTTKTIVITRPVGDEKTLTDVLHLHGYRVIHEPLTSIYLHHTQRQALEHALMDEPDAVIVTSRHAVAALAFLSDMRDIFLICVGEATAKVAQSLGFTRVSTAGGTVTALVESIPAAYDEGSRFLYLSGEHVRMDIGAALARHAMHVERLVLYEAIASEQLSDILLEHLRREQLDGITFLSQRTAEIFTSLLAKANMGDTARHLHGFALSATIAGTLKALPWKYIHTAREATLASLLECVDNVFQTKE